MSDRQLPSPFAQVSVLGLGMFGLLVGGRAFMKGLLYGTVHPVEIAAKLAHWRDVVLDAVPVVAGSLAGAVVVVAVAVLAARHGRAVVRAWLAVWWRYRRRWRRVMADNGLTVEATKGRMLVPDLRAVAVGPDADVLTVAPLPGQSPAYWHGRGDALAAAFGAATGRIRWDACSGGESIDVVLSRSGSADPPARKALSARAPVVLTVPVSERQPAAVVRAFGLHILWARVGVPGNNGRTRRLSGVRIRWFLVSKVVTA